MPDLEVNADLLVDDGASTRQLNVDDFKAVQTGDATETTLEAVRAAVDGVEDLLASIRDNTDDLELSLSDLDINTDGLEAALSAMLTELGEKIEAGDITGLATQTTLAAVLAKLTADPSTATKQDTANASLASLDGKLPDESGTWGYAAGSSGTVNLTGGKRLLGVTATGGAAAASMTINGGDSITIPANQAIEFSPRANVTNPTLVFSSTAAYVVEYLT